VGFLPSSVHDTADIGKTSPFLWVLVVALASQSPLCLGYSLKDGRLAVILQDIVYNVSFTIAEAITNHRGFHAAALYHRLALSLGP
jgi:hypothetical protein